MRNNFPNIFLIAPVRHSASLLKSTTPDHLGQSFWHRFKAEAKFWHCWQLNSSAYRAAFSFLSFDMQFSLTCPTSSMQLLLLLHPQAKTGSIQQSCFGKLFSWPCSSYLSFFSSSFEASTMVESPRIPSSDTMKTLSETRTHHSRTLALSYLLPAIRQNSMLQLTTEKLHLSFMLSSIRLRSRSCLFPDQPTRTCSQLFDQIQKVKVVDYKSKFYHLWLKRSLIRSMLLFLIGQGEDSFFCCSLASIRGLLSAFCLALHANDGSLHALSFHIQKIFLISLQFILIFVTRISHSKYIFNVQET